MSKSIPHWIKWEEMAWEKVEENIHRKVVVGDRIMMVMYRFGPHQIWPKEIHEAEQGGYVLKGEIELNLPAEERRMVLRTGDGYLIGSKVPHSWKTFGEETILIDIFSPPRIELIEKSLP